MTLILKRPSEKRHISLWTLCRYVTELTETKPESNNAIVNQIFYLQEFLLARIYNFKISSKLSYFIAIIFFLRLLEYQADLLYSFLWHRNWSNRSPHHLVPLQISLTRTLHIAHVCQIPARTASLVNSKAILAALKIIMQVLHHLISSSDRPWSK